MRDFLSEAMLRRPKRIGKYVEAGRAGSRSKKSRIAAEMEF
jgi:hypothetical protein